MGYRGGNAEAPLVWHEDVRLWVLLYPEYVENRFWCAFGPDDPRPVASLSITCEINPPKEGINRRCAGVFVRSERDEVFLAHSGKVGGGRPGIGKSAFLEQWLQTHNDDFIPVYFPDQRENNYIILGRIDDPELRVPMAEFVRAVARFKDATAGPEAI